MLFSPEDQVPDRQIGPIDAVRKGIQRGQQVVGFENNSSATMWINNFPEDADGAEPDV